MMGPFVVVFEWFLFDCIVSSRITSIPATPILGWLHSLRCHRLSYGLLCGWWSTGGAIFLLIWSCSQMCFWLCFPTREMSSALCVPLIPWICWGIWNEDSIFHVSGAKLIQKTRPYLLGAWRNTLKCCMQFRIAWPMPDACLLGNSLLLGFLLDLYWIQGREYWREVGSLPIALDVKFSATFSWSSLSMVSVELKFSCTHLEIGCFLAKKKMVQILSQRDEHEQCRRKSKITHTVIGG